MNPHFASLVLGLAQQAESTLNGTLPPGAAEAGATDTREIARSLIDTLGMLDQKTKGNLEPDEAALLTQAITTLRFTFVKQGGGGTG